MKEEIDQNSVRRNFNKNKNKRITNIKGKKKKKKGENLRASEMKGTIFQRVSQWPFKWQRDKQIVNEGLKNPRAFGRWLSTRRGMCGRVLPMLVYTQLSVETWHTRVKTTHTQTQRKRARARARIRAHTGRLNGWCSTWTAIFSK